MRLYTSSVWNESNIPWDRVSVNALADASESLTRLLRAETSSEHALVVIQPNFSGYNVEVWSDADFTVISAFLSKHQRIEIDRSDAKLAELYKAETESKKK
jgi:hypothetical protein